MATEHAQRKYKLPNFYQDGRTAPLNDLSTSSGFWIFIAANLFMYYYSLYKKWNLYVSDLFLTFSLKKNRINFLVGCSTIEYTSILLWYGYPRKDMLKKISDASCMHDDFCSCLILDTFMWWIRYPNSNFWVPESWNQQEANSIWSFIEFWQSF